MDQPNVPRDAFEAITQSAARNARVLATSDPDELDSFSFLTDQHPFIVAMTCITFVDLLRMAVGEQVTPEGYVQWIADKTDLLERLCGDIADDAYGKEDQ